MEIKYFILRMTKGIIYGGKGLVKGVSEAPFSTKDTFVKFFDQVREDIRIKNYRQGVWDLAKGGFDTVTAGLHSIIAHTLLGVGAGNALGHVLANNKGLSKFAFGNDSFEAEFGGVRQTGRIKKDGFISKGVSFSHGNKSEIKEWLKADFEAHTINSVRLLPHLE